MIYIRNDDVSSDCDLTELKRFCEIIDKYGFKIIHGITLNGPVIPIDSKWDNDKIESVGIDKFEDRKDIIDFIKSRNDEVAYHGFYHWHHCELRLDQMPLVLIGIKDIGNIFGKEIKYFIPPFNEHSLYMEGLCKRKDIEILSTDGEHLEYYLDGQPLPQNIDTVWRCHSWRFYKVYDYEKLDRILYRIKNG